MTDTKHAGSWLTVKCRVPLFLWSEKGRRGVVSRQACGAPKVIARPCVTCSSINVASYVGYESETPSIPHLSLSLSHSHSPEIRARRSVRLASSSSSSFFPHPRSRLDLAWNALAPRMRFHRAQCGFRLLPRWWEWRADSSGCARFPARWVNGLSPRLPSFPPSCSISSMSTVLASWPHAYLDRYIIIHAVFFLHYAARLRKK